MSRPDRPYRASRVLANRTVHHDFATKKERDEATCTEDKRTTVTSRKPLKPGTPVCWVNVYAEGTGPSPAVHSTKEFADRGADKTRRLHCIPVYLPGEGAESLGQQDAEGYELEARTQRERADKAEAKVSDMAVRLCIATGGRGMSEDEQRMSRALQDAARGAHDALAEAERLKSQLSDSRGYGDLQRERANKAEAEVEWFTKLNKNLEFAMVAGNEQLARDTADLADLRREVERLTKERDAAQKQADVRDETMTRIRVALTNAGIPEVEPYPDPGADERERQLRAGGRCIPTVDRLERLIAQRDAAQAQAMPAGKVVYGASGKFGINRDFQTIEFADKRLRDTYRKTDGWT